MYTGVRGGRIHALNVYAVLFPARRRLYTYRIVGTYSASAVVMWLLNVEYVVRLWFRVMLILTFASI